MKIRITAVPRKPVDAAGLVSTLVDLATSLREKNSAKNFQPEASEDSDA